MTELETLADEIMRDYPNPLIWGDVLEKLTAAYTLGRAAATSAKRRAASKTNGATPVKPGSRPRGRPAGSGKKQQEMRP